MISRGIPRTTVAAVCAAALGLGACGGIVENGAAEAVVLVGSDNDATFAIQSCFADDSAVALGTTAESAPTIWALSPARRYLALATGETGVDIVATENAAVHHLAGDGVTATGMRWSDDERRLAYFASGVPMLADGDGSNASAVDLALPPAPTEYSFQDAEWSSDGSNVAFVTRGIAVLVDPNTDDVRMSCDRAISKYGSPWSIAFSPDGSVFALLRASETDDRTVLLTRTDTLESNEITGIQHYAFFGWSTDGEWLAVGDTSVNLWLVPRTGGDHIALGGPGALSPVAPEVAFVGNSDQALHVQSLGTWDDRIVTATSGGFPRWSPDGSVLTHQTSGSTSAVSAADGSVVVPSSSWISVGPSDWLVRGDGSNTLLSRRLGQASDTAAFALDQVPPSSDQFEWLPGGKMGFLAAGALHVTNPNGSGDHVPCTGVRAMLSPQGSRLPW